MIRFRWSYAIPLAVLAVGGGLAAAPAFAATSGTFSVTGSMNAARVNDTATVLPSGQVLVAGSGFGSVTLASAELYNPATAKWTLTGSMTTPREDQTATLLGNGQVLVSGGIGTSGTALASAELYNPATGTWTATGSMSTPRAGHDATLLPSGDVLVTAGTETAGAFSELYNPATGTWSAAAGGLAACGTATECRFGSTAVLLGTGNVLVAGGLAGTNSNPGTTTAAILYDPATNSWTTTGSLNTARQGQTEDLLASGQVLVAGGEGFTKHAGTPLSSAELYTP